MAKNKSAPEIIKLRSIYFGGEPQIPGEKFIDGNLSFGDTVPGMELSWVRYNDLMIADRCACVDISWNTLNQLGYVFGHPVRIDGKSYLCRCPEMGPMERSPNEWDDILNATTEDPNFWHCFEQWFWGQDTVEDVLSHRGIRGYYSPRYSASCPPANHTAMLGFRPILEPLPPAPSDLNTLIGKHIFVSGPQGTTIGGKLVEFDEYDLLLENVDNPQVKCDWVSQTNGGTTVDRASILWLTETKKAPR